MRPYANTIEADELGGFADATLKVVERFRHRRLSADEAKHDALRVGYEAQRFEVSSSGGVVLKQEVGGVGAAEKALRNRLVAAFGEIAAPTSQLTLEVARSVSSPCRLTFRC